MEVDFVTACTFFHKGQCEGLVLVPRDELRRRGVHIPFEHTLYKIPVDAIGPEFGEVGDARIGCEREERTLWSSELGRTGGEASFATFGDLSIRVPVGQSDAMRSRRVRMKKVLDTTGIWGGM